MQKQQTLANDQSQHFTTPGAPIVAQASQHAGAITGQIHSHDRAQLILSVSQPARISLPWTDLMLEAGSAAWLPGGVRHGVSARQGPLFHSLYIRQDLAETILIPTGSLYLSPFLTELISRLLAEQQQGESSMLYPHLAALIIAELSRHQLLYQAPARGLPAHRDLRRICETLIRNPADARTLAEWAKALGSSRRRLERLFIAETGSSFRDWQAMIRIFAAKQLLATGRPVKQVAWMVGYNSSSAFSAMFRRQTGQVPSAARENNQQSSTTSPQGTA